MNTKLTVDIQCFDIYMPIVELITIHLFAEFKNWHSNINNNITREQNFLKNKIMNSFQEVYENCHVFDNINNEENDYEGTLEKLNRLGSAVNIDINFRILIEQYCRLCLDDQKIELIIINFDSSLYKEKHKKQLGKIYEAKIFSSIQIKD